MIEDIKVKGGSGVEKGRKGRFVKPLGRIREGGYLRENLSGECRRGRQDRSGSNQRGKGGSKN